MHAPLLEKRPRVQAKLRVNAPNDAFEQEADRMADRVVGQGTSGGAMHNFSAFTQVPVSRKCAACEAEQEKPVQRMHEEDEEASVQRKEDEEDIVQAKSTTGGFAVDSGFESQLNARKGGGAPLDDNVRGQMERGFGADFGGVRIHTGGEAAGLSRQINAKAFTHGNDVFFGAGEYQPQTAQGKRLLAHELTHTIQQGGAEVQRVEDDWVDDYYYNTRPEAERRVRLETEKHKDREYRIIEITVSNETKYRVQYRTAKDEDPPKEDKPKDEAPDKEAPDTVKPDGGEEEGTESTEATIPSSIPYVLTFDDGPHAAGLGSGTNRTENVLDVLSAEGIKGMFFIQTGVSYRGANSVGRQLVRRMNKDGHIVAVHTGGTADHELHTKAEKAGRLEGELNDAKDYISETTKPVEKDDPAGQSATWVRPPTGAYNSDVTATYGKVKLQNLMWDIDGDQGKDLDLKTLLSRVRTGIDNVAAGGWAGTTAAAPKVVVLHHDIQKGTSNNIKTIIDEIRKYTQTKSGKKATAKFVLP